ncbi:MAG TPA: hypothetical protein VIX86_14395 [Streptosporangiaceae bacterium]
MTRGGVPDGDMPNFPWSGRREPAPFSDAALAALLAGADLPAGAPPELRSVAEALTALTDAPAGDELAGEAMALAAFRNRLGVPRPVTRRRRRPPLLAPLMSAKAAVLVAALSLGGLATAAYTNVLPAPAQQFAHSVIGAPAAHPTHTAHPANSASPVGPDATGHPAYGLCNAWSHAKAHGTHKQEAVAFRNLAAAAGGAANVAAFCAAVPHPGNTAHPHGKPTVHPTPHHHGKPAAHPTPHHPTGKPTAHPTPSHPTGQT